MLQTARIAAITLCATLLPLAAAAHGGAADAEAEAVWSQWRIISFESLAFLAVGAIYLAGALRLARRRTHPRGEVARHTLFGAGLLLIFLSLQSPLDIIAEHVFAMHQVQHLLLRMMGPMLMVLAAPQPFLIAGLPRTLRNSVLAPVTRGRALRRVFGLLVRPDILFVLFTASLYVWQIPALHNRAILHEPTHWAMHITMTAAGFLFWWRIFDRRPPPQGLRYGVRMMLLWLSILSNIVLGAYLALKTDVLYPAYDELGRFWGLAPLADERFGAVTIWVPGSMMCVIAALVVIHAWGRHESRIGSRISGSGITNRAFATGFGIFVFAVFTIATLIGISAS